ncbi:restriction endonuclease subunit S [Amycolatopsis taiwanensis]|uniref:Type I restriction modification DNA specificity domain-containing protein n=1 Tax=Amycolatopsis taiwanensis TaxID=342230 RepID=A0A9W6VBA8_9PSEU|nr:restriction endonuclease subunit S [Amycolatopsis taiwanensis]GLY64748.1 hypothetical protein Atai01_13670 [Amycolatopsis taiwanensis]
MFVTDEKQVPLKELVEITAGPSGSLLDRLGSDPDGVPVISPSDITEHHRVDTRKLRRLPETDAAKLSRFALRGGDLVVVRQGSLGRLALIRSQREAWLYNSSCFRLRPRNNRVLPEYLTLYLSFPPVQEELLNRAVPGTVQSLNSSVLGELSITVPPVERQQEIVAVVGDIEDVVQVHRDTADRLEDLRLSILGDFFEAV